VPCRGLLAFGGPPLVSTDASVSVAAGDLNGDGTPDLVLANQNSNSVTVLLGQGDSTFAPGVDYPTGASPWSVAIADLNGDSRPDLVVANHDSNSVSVLMGKGEGTFAAQVDYPTGDSPGSVAVGDINGDGKLDLLLPNMSTYENTVTVLFGQR